MKIKLLMCITLFVMVVLSSCSFKAEISPNSGSEQESSQQQSTAQQQNTTKPQSNAPSAPSSSSQPTPPPSSSAPTSQSQSVAESNPDIAASKGKVLALGNAKLSFPSDAQVATQSELDKWNELIGAGTITSLDVCNMNDKESELSVESYDAILKALMGADLGLYDTLGNPMTGGAVHVIAYNSSGSSLFHATYNGEWFVVAFGGGNIGYVFNGEGTSLDNLYVAISS